MTFLADVIWPALYVMHGYYTLWPLIIVTVVIEALILRHFIRLPVVKSFMISSVGNAISGVFGMQLLIFIPLLFHYIADPWTGGTFNTIGWIATFLLMFGTSVVIEVYSVGFLFRLKRRRLWFPLFAGNFLTYLVIAIYFNISSQLQM
ncbi:hypothetical protein CH373_06385 [Leptospira perolatii]|uniref:Uncharacterized protein n=1 Tax=Leptospira perolatii TaxID=2023191 RepID=A0A2M9ZP20_9LEPT|nr:hypothetical protein [Leptospira perolatii]PJZ70888.1 hypothetical protein CH360_05115 [Leptospira perolatii]PJZ73784.1 hypothetical protein CH373_06385 [Leptospira perolatii]